MVRTLTTTDFVVVGASFVAAAIYWTLPARVRIPFLAALSVGFLMLASHRSAAIFAIEAAVCLLYERTRRSADGWSAKKGVLCGAIAIVAAPLLAIRLTSTGSEFSRQIIAGVSVETIGVAYFTLQAISFLLFVDRERPVNPPASQTVLYLGFYPHAFAGPVLRPERFLPELAAHTHFDFGRFADGVLLVIFGLFKKRVFADGLVGGLQTIPQSPSLLSRSIVCLLLFAGTYLDVSGYVDIARGLGKIFGLNIPVNFSAPLTRSRSIQNFWQRWQVTLMGWFRDHIYAPIARSRGSRNNLLALVVTFAAVAFWHGLSITWARWFIVVTVGVVLDHFIGRLGGRSPDISRAVRIIRRVLVPIYVYVIAASIAWPAADQLAGLWRLHGTASQPIVPLIRLLLISAVCVAGLEELELRRDSRVGRRRRLLRTECVLGGLMLVTLVLQIGTPARLLIYGAF